MDLLIEPITPAVRLHIQIIDVGKANARPEAIFNDPHAPLDFALGLWFVRLTDPGSHPERSHEIGKDRVPLGNIVFHLQKKAFHEIVECRFEKVTKVLTSHNHDTTISYDI